jgi:hypothetical protein
MRLIIVAGAVSLFLCRVVEASQPPSDVSTKDRYGASATGPAAQLAIQLGLDPHFLIGMGNDLAGDHDRDGIYTLGTRLDLHYCYLVGLMGQGGWPDWNPGGSFVNIMTNSAAAHGVVPMFTYYTMASWGEGNMTVLTNDNFMLPFWNGVALLFDRLSLFNQPAVVHLEPDFWAYAQQRAPGHDPQLLPVHVSSLAPDCADFPDDLRGMGRCIIQIARNRAPQVAVGFHASRWAGTVDQTIAFLNGIGAGDSDLLVLDMLDRDAGCFEAHVDPACQRSDGPWYWDETNQTSPNFHEHLDYANALYQGIGKPLLWWQLPFGVPSDTPGGTAGHYRDNRVRYIFNHVDEFVAAGGLGAAFGTGASNQTYITTDDGQFRQAVSNYFASPTALP